MTCFTRATDLIEQLEQMATERSGLQDTSRRLASQLEREQVSHGEDLCVHLKGLTLCPCPLLQV